MRMSVIIVTGFLALTLPGCANNFWFSPNKSRFETEKDAKNCEYESLKYSREASVRESKLFAMCMENKGYSLVNKYSVLRKGNEFYRSGQFNEALGYYDRSAYDFPDDPAVYHNMGAAYYELGRMKLAMEYFDKSIKLKPDFYLPYTGRGMVYIKTKELDKAISDFDKAASLNSKSPYPYIGRGAYYLEKKKYDEAMQELNTAIDTNDGLDEAFYYRGEAHMGNGDIDLAVADYKKSCEAGKHEACSKYKKISRNK